jgi:pseudaminic acid cytidylyltransferase
MSNLAIIPARGGSKRIPRKNIKDFLGKPIIAYSIEAALESGLFDEVMVSTDDEEIAEVSKRYGAKVPFMRSYINSGDYATLADVVEEVINAYKNREQEFIYGCCILPTAPLIKIENLFEAFDLLKNKNFHSVRPIVPFSYPIQRAFLVEKNGKLSWYEEESAIKRSQDLVSTFHDSGQFYWFKTKYGLKSPEKGGLIIPEYGVQDIDTETDWKMAELKYELINKLH